MDELAGSIVTFEIAGTEIGPLAEDPPTRHCKFFSLLPVSA